MFLIWTDTYRLGENSPKISTTDNLHNYSDINRPVYGLTSGENILLTVWVLSENSPLLERVVAHGFNCPNGQPLPPELHGQECLPCRPNRCKECLLEKLGRAAQSFRGYVEETEKNDPT